MEEISNLLILLGFPLSRIVQIWLSPRKASMKMGAFFM